MRKRRFASICLQVFRVRPGLFCVEYLISLLGGVCMAFAGILLETFFSAVLAVPQEGPVRALWLLLVLLLLYMAQGVAESVSGYCGERYANRTVCHFTEQINRKIARLDPIAFEIPAQLDAVEKAYAGAIGARQILNTVLELGTFYVPYFLLIGFYLYRQRPILLLCLVLLFLPALFAELRKLRRFRQLEEDAAPLRRKKNAFASYLSAKAFFKETRVLGATAWFQKKFSGACETLRKLKGRAYRSANRANCASALCTAAGYLGVLLLLLDSAFRGLITVPAFAAIFAMVGTLFGAMQEAISYGLGSFAEDYGKIENYCAFLDLKERSDGGLQPGPIQEVSCRGVSFSYLSKPDVLRNVTLELHRGEIVALVGENGSGKSTLLRLLAGIYQPASGEITYNGIPASQLSRQALFQDITCLFQKFGTYQMTVSDNVHIGDFAKGEAGIPAALAGAGFQGPSPDALLGREFGGTELSGGQWQRLALARAIFRQGELICLDEPTSAIDPVQESQLYLRIAQLCQGKAALLATHRLGIVRLCSRILVLRNGEIVASGTHEQLLKSSPYYRRLWDSQASLYQKKPAEAANSPQGGTRAPNIKEKTETPAAK